MLKRYEKWKDIVSMSGPDGLRQIRGFRGEVLRGDWKGHRLSCLNIQYRVIYKIVKEYILDQVVDVAPHDYRRK